MARFSKKNVFEAALDSKQHLPRKGRSHKTTSNDKFERRHSWGYTKRRTLIAE